MMNVNIVDISRGKLVKARISRMKLKDFDSIYTSGKFTTIKWNELKVNMTEIFKLVKGSSILGLILFFHERLFNRLEINKLEVCVDNVGSGKNFENIAGCLIAFACLHSIQHMDGEVYVIPTKKTKQIYLEKYGMENFNLYYVKSSKSNSIKLVHKYLNIIIP